jgi:hypothetical protein
MEIVSLTCPGAVTDYPSLIYILYQFFGSALVSIRIRIRSQVSEDLDPDPGQCGSVSGYKDVMTQKLFNFYS